MRTQATGHGVRGWLRSVRGRRILGVVSLAAAALAIFLASTKPDPFASTRSYYAAMDNVKGLGSIDRDIRLAGVNVGHIGDVERVDDDAIIELVMEQEIPIHADATVRLRPHTLFEGSAFVDLSPGSPSAPPLQEGGMIDRQHTSTYVTLDEATRLFRKPVRKTLRNLLKVASNTLRGRAIEGTQRLFKASPELTENLGPTARALQGTHRRELAQAITGLSATVRGVADRADRLGPLLAASNRTLAALQVDGGEPLARTLETLPSLLERLVVGAPVVVDLIDRVDGLAAEVNPAFADLTPAVAELTPVVEDAIPVLEDVTPMIADLRIVLAPLADAAPTVLRLTEELLPGNRLLVNSVLPTLDAPSREGLPAYAQLLSTFSGVDAAARTFQPTGEPGGGQGSGHFMRLGMYLDPDFPTGTAFPNCDVVAQINPDAAVALEGAGLCTP